MQCTRNHAFSIARVAFGAGFAKETASAPCSDDESFSVASKCTWHGFVLLTAPQCIQYPGVRQPLRTRLCGGDRTVVKVFGAA